MDNLANFVGVERDPVYLTGNKQATEAASGETGTARLKTEAAQVTFVTYRPTLSNRLRSS